MVLLFSSATSGDLAAATPVVAAPGGLIVVYAQGPRDLLSTLSVRILDDQAHVVSTAPANAIAIDTDDEDDDVTTYVAHLPAPLVSGSYLVRWQGTGPEHAAEEALIVTVLPAWAPTLEQVAALCPAYTRRPVDDDGEQIGREAGFFDDRTDPTAVEVQGYIVAAVNEVAGRVGIGAVRLNAYADLASQTAAWHAAATIDAEKGSQGSPDADLARGWKWSSYVACLKDLQARVPSALRIA